MDTGSNYLAFSDDSIEKLIKPHMREKYENAVKSFSEANIKIHEANIILQKEWGLINSLSAT
jgi:hypothetical protein